VNVQGEYPRTNLKKLPCNNLWNNKKQKCLPLARDFMYITSYFVWSCRFCPVAQEVSGSLGKDSGWSAIICSHVFSCKSLSTVHEINIDACNWTICQFHYLDFLNPPEGNAVMGRLVGESYPPNRTDKTSHQHMFQKSCTNLSVATKTPHPLWTFKGTTSCVAANGIQLQTWKRCYRKLSPTNSCGWSNPKKQYNQYIIQNGEFKGWPYITTKRTKSN